MRANQIMTANLVTIGPEASIVDAANAMLEHHVSGLPVVDGGGRLIGIISEGDFIRRAELGTQRKRSRWLRLLLGPGTCAADFVHEHGRKVGEVMTHHPHTISEDTSIEAIVRTMEKHHVKRLPVMRGDQLVGIVTRKNLLRAVANLAREVPDPTTADDKIREKIVAEIDRNDWRPFGLSVLVRDGVVHLNGVITEERSRQAAIVAAENVCGVREVHDHLCWVDTMSGFYLNSPEDDRSAKTAT
ncbi:putative signal-transduction protein with CBS domains [Rhodopseudomonas palustris HaA2]|uniref:Putative signal-transduction protein with CBS domains n=1 Tax=Rhodopseudomonas palustris (strain HaA2) TaxID=316058 RepID=Q2J0D5_RHOP2|nr:CBS domain-containing protein [Rhodopseudomonas palustris]ABD06075.1 putative signal-transduction protein with CBS domains [Rhodopseudomonas palustris HaA2]